MKGLVLLVFVGALAPGPTAQETSQFAYRGLFQAVWQTVNDNFYDPSFGGVDWAAVQEKYRRETADIKDDAAFHSLVTRMLNELQVSHLGLSPPEHAPAWGIGVRTRELEDDRVITLVATASDAQRQGLRAGDVLLTISEQIRGDPGSTATLRVRSCEGMVRDVKVRRENAWWPPGRPSIRWKTIEQAPGKRIGYLQAVRFDDDAAPLIDAAMEDLKNATGLIIDVRNNSGGNVSMLRLVSYFLSGSQPAVALLTRSFLDRLGRAPAEIDFDALPRAGGVYTTAGILEAMSRNGGGVALYTEDVGDQAYRGRVVVLISEETGSAAEGFAWSMKSQTSAVLLGRKTAGALLGSERFDLPGGWQLTVPTHAGWGPDGKLYRDAAVSPHIEVSWTRRDLCEGQDTDLVKALDLLAHKK